MANKRTNPFQNLNNLLFGYNSVTPDVMKLPPTMDSLASDTVLYSTNDKEDYERKLTAYKQQKLLSYQWVKAGADNALESLQGYTAVKLMYRDADLMDGMPEIGSALDIISEEACNFGSAGNIITVKSKSKRVKEILEDLFDNRLHIHITLPMIARAMVKYGNQFMLLNVTKDNGIMGWKQLPVYEMDRIENGFTTSPAAGYVPRQMDDIVPDSTKFVWVGHNEGMPYQDWQIAHFRLLNDSFFLPYGLSHLHKARRAWRMWSMMEDAMFIYRLDKSIQRRVFKIYVGAIDDKDVPAFVQDVANNFKRTPVVDPLTGQIDLRKNFLDVSADYFIPVRDPSAPTPIENLPSAENPTAMDDINYMQSKVFAALRVPKTFLNFQEAQGKGQNLSLLDIRFCRMINRIQTFLIMELNKVAMLHLTLLGLKDEVTNFTITMNNPSAQIEALELEDMTKRIQTATAALADPGIGMPLMSLHMVLKKIMKMTDAEIQDMLLEIRLEKAMAAELEQTANVIKKTGIFDSVDRIYGDYAAMNAPEQGQQQQQGMGGDDMMGGGAAGGMGGGGFDGGALMSDSLGGGEGDMSGMEGSADMSSAPDLDNGGPEPGPQPSNEGKDSKPVINEKRTMIKSFTERYLDLLKEAQKKEEGEGSADFESKNAVINEEVDALFNKIDQIIESNCDDTNFTLNEAADISDDDIDEELAKN